MKHNYSNQINAFDAKTNFSHLLQRVRAGEKITILKHNVPIAFMVPIPNTQTSDITEVIESINKFRVGKKLQGISIEQLKNEGQR